MSSVTPALLKLAGQLIVREAKATKSSAHHPDRAFSVIDNLRPHLTNLMGKTGFQALLARALLLATAQDRLLRAVHLSAEGGWEGLAELEARVSLADFFEASVVMLAQLLGLLVAFVGEALVLQLLIDIWPNHSVNELEFGKKAINEKTN